MLLEGQPYIPKYFGYNLNINKEGAPAYKNSISQVEKLQNGANLPEGALVIDARKNEQFAAGHTRGAINIMNREKFETWLGSIVGPEERFFIVSDSEAELNILIDKAAKIGYELLILGVVVNPSGMTEKSDSFDLKTFKANPEAYTIVDIRSKDEYTNSPIFNQSINIPLHELRERASEIPTEKPILVHCAGGYRSAAASSIVEAIKTDTQVLDFSDAIKGFQ
jgi:rhodanese-related sulfurtransferase